MTTQTTDYRALAAAAAACAPVIATATTAQKNAALRRMATLLDAQRNTIIDANNADIAAAKKDGVDASLLSRLVFDNKKIASRIRCLEKIAALPDPVGETYVSDRRPNGLVATRVRVPLGVILMIYEARPHVTVNAGALCLKAGNTALLRGGKEATRCNELMGNLWQNALRDADLPVDAIHVISGTHDDVATLLSCDDYITLAIPRGGPKLIAAVAERATMPVIKHYEGICHLYIDQTATLEKACALTLDSKCLMPEVCNAMETLLIHHSRDDMLPPLIDALKKAGVTVKGCAHTRGVVPTIEEATEEDWRTEYLDMTLSIRSVPSCEAAIDHINTYGSHHTDSIVTDSYHAAQSFVTHVDSGVVLVNASTMFCDGETLGMGAEIGISTDKIHARGPMGMTELTTYKHVIYGNGQRMGSA